MSRRWKSALIGAAICGIAGPTIGVILLNVYLWRLQWLAGAPIILFEEWVVASLGFGPPAFFLGAIGAIILQRLIRQRGSIKGALIETAALGLTLGSVVPVTTNVACAAWARAQGLNLRNDEILFELPLAAITGIICELLVLWLLHRMQLLSEKDD